MYEGEFVVETEDGVVIAHSYKLIRAYQEARGLIPEAPLKVRYISVAGEEAKFEQLKLFEDTSFMENVVE